MSDLYDNLLKATDNTNDITTEKYGIITKLEGLFCSVKETETSLEHTNVPILNGANLTIGDKVIIGFINNSIYDVVVYGCLDKTIHDNTKQDKLISGTNIKTINNTSILGSGNIVIEGGGTSVDIATNWGNPVSDEKVPSEKLTKDTLDDKVDKETGKSLSTNDFTDNYKTTMDSLKTVATSGSYTDLTNKPSIPSSSSDLSDGSNLIKKSSTIGLVKNDGTIDTTSYSTFDGNYNNLSNKPIIPSKISDLTNDSDFIEKSNTTGLLKNDGTVDTNTYLTTSSASSTYIPETDIADNLTTDDNTKVLSASQGGALLDVIDSAISAIVGDDISISLSASNPYILSGETTDLVVSLGVGSVPLANRSVTITDGTSVYTGITNSNGTYTEEDVSVTGNTTFTASYKNIVSGSCNVIYPCLFVDYGVSGKYNSNWTNDSNWMTVTRSDEYTTLSNTVNTYAVCRANNNTAFAGDITIEWDNHSTAASTLFIGIRGTSAVNKSFTSLGIDGNCHVKVTVIGTTATVYVDNVETSSYTINRDNNSKVTVLFQVSRGNSTIQYSNFVIH